MAEERRLFHTADLALLWRISTPNSLYTTVKRYVDRGILQPIQKGYYATGPTKQIDPIPLGIGALHRYAYLSTESVLAHHGIIFQEAGSIALVSSLSKTFTLLGHQYRVRQLHDRFLYHDAGIHRGVSHDVASVERAVADLLYFQPSYHLDNPSINWKDVARIQTEVGYT